MIRSEGSMSKLKLALSSNFTIAKFSHEADRQFYHQVLQEYDMEAVHLHGTYMQTSEEGAGHPLQ